MYPLGSEGDAIPAPVGRRSREVGAARRLYAPAAQDGNRNGWIKDYAIYFSPDGKGWGEPAAEGAVPFGPEPTCVSLQRPVEGRLNSSPSVPLTSSPLRHWRSSTLEIDVNTKQR